MHEMTAPKLNMLKRSEQPNHSVLAQKPNFKFSGSGYQKLHHNLIKLVNFLLPVIWECQTSEITSHQNFFLPRFCCQSGTVDIISH